MRVDALEAVITQLRSNPCEYDQTNTQKCLLGLAMQWLAPGITQKQIMTQQTFAYRGQENVLELSREQFISLFFVQNWPEQFRKLIAQTFVLHDCVKKLLCKEVGFIAAERLEHFLATNE